MDGDDLPAIHGNLERRRKKLLDFDHYKRKVEQLTGTEKEHYQLKLAEKQGRMSDAETELVRVTSLIEHQVNSLRAERRAALPRELGALVACQSHFYSHGVDSTEHLALALPFAACVAVDLVGRRSGTRRRWCCSSDADRLAGPRW